MQSNVIEVSTLARTDANARDRFVTQARRKIEHEAYQFWTADEFCDAVGGADFTALIKAAESAPPDLHDQLGTRYRLFGAALLFPWDKTRTIHVIPPEVNEITGEPFVRYFQPKEINADAGGKTRHFGAIPDHIWQSSSLAETIWLQLDATPRSLVSHDQPVKVQVHLINLKSDGIRAGVSLPDHLHRDLDPVTYVLLLGRSKNAAGGITHIAPPSAADFRTNSQDLKRAELLAERTLHDALSGFGFWDSRVSHSLTPVYSTDGKPAYRSALLTDFGNITL